jgi:uncharacterized protein involved in exopolysaccharide biosynthesis
VYYYRRTGMTVGFLLLLIGVVAAIVIPPNFTSHGRVLILSGSVYEMQPSSSATARVTDSAVAASTEMELLSSSELHRTVVKRELGPAATTAQINEALISYEANLHITKLDQANVIDITFRDQKPQRAAQGLKDLLAAYFEERAQVLTSGRVGFLTTQRDKIKGQLDQANEELEAYQKQKGVVDVAAQITSAVQNDGLLQQHKADADAAVADSRRSVDVLRDSAEGVPAEVELFTDNTESARTIGTMEASLFQLEARRADLASRYMVTSPFVKQIDQQIASLETSIAQQKSDATIAKRTGYNTYHDTVRDRLAQAQATLAGAIARRDVLSAQVATSAGRLKDLIAVSDTIARMVAQRDILADTFKDLTLQLENARVQQNQASATSTTNVRVIESPEIPAHRNNPPILFLAGALFAAVAIAGVTVIILSSVRETFLSPLEAERALKLPVLCDIPRRDTNGIPVRRDFGRLLGAIDSIPTDGMGRAVLLLTAYSEGKLHVVAHGLVAALEPRAPGRIALVRLEEESASADPESGQLVTMRPMDGNARVTAGIGVSRSRLVGLLQELRSTYDYVIMTAPPASICFESVEISAVADLTLLLVQAEETRKPVAESIINQVAYIGGYVSGLIMTGRRFYIPAWLYHRVIDRRTSDL